MASDQEIKDRINQHQRALVDSCVTAPETAASKLAEIPTLIVGVDDPIPVGVVTTPKTRRQLRDERKS